MVWLELSPICRLTEDVGLGEAAAFCIEHTNSAACAASNALENGDELCCGSAVVSDALLIRVGTNYCEGFDLGWIERKDAMVVLQEDDRLVGYFTRESDVLRRINF